jgi:hypothetical protein
VILLEDVLDYLGDAKRPWLELDESGEDWYPEIERAFATETAAQAGRCRVLDESGDYLVLPDLDEALLRRVACNLARRVLPLAYAMGEGESVARFPKHDPEIARLEAPHRKIVIG